MQVVFENLLTARQTTSDDSNFVTEISESASERPDMNGRAAFPSHIDTWIVTQIENVHLPYLGEESPAHRQDSQGCSGEQARSPSSSMISAQSRAGGL